MKTLNRYQQDALLTRSNKYTQEDDISLIVGALGITGEAGEVADLVKKYIAHGHQLDKQKLIKELGDVLWYVAVLATTIGVTLEEVADANIKKLNDRYPNGFTTEDSINRKE